MKIRKLLLLPAVAVAVFALSSCSDELTNIVPEPVNSDDTSYTGGTGGEDIETE